MKNNTIQFTTQLFWSVVAIVLILIPVINNGYPMFTSDSGTYIWSGFLNQVPIDRPLFYGLFVRHTSLKASLWFTIISQGVIAYFLINQVFNRFLIASQNQFKKFVIIAIVMAYSSLGWFVGQIMPDIFVGFAFIAFALLLLGKNTSVNTALLTLILIGSSIAHNSHLLIITGLLVCSFIFYWFNFIESKSLITLKHLLYLLSIIAVSWFINPTINYFADGNFKHSGSPRTFLVAKNVENGMVDKYLSTHCKVDLNELSKNGAPFYIGNVGTNKFIDLAAFNKADGAPYYLWNYTGASNQQFTIEIATNNSIKLISKESLKYLTTNTDAAGKVELIQADSKNDSAQLFKFDLLINNQMGIYSLANSKYLGALNNSENGASFYFVDSVISDNERFNLVSGENYLYYFKDNLPNTAISYLWDTDNVNWRVNGWDPNNESYKKILSDIYFSPKYFASNIGLALSATLTQLTHFDIGDGLYVYGKESSPYLAINKHLPFELKNYNNSKQNRGALSLIEVNKRSFPFTLFSIVIILFFIFSKRLRATFDKKLLLFIVLFIVMLVINAFVTGALANVLDRLQSRLMWITPLIAIVLMANFITQYHLVERLTKWVLRSDTKD